MIVTNAGRDAVDVEAPITNGTEADGEGVWSWHPDAGVKLAGSIPPVTVARKPVAGESAQEAVKTIARGMPGDSGVTWLTRVRIYHYHCTRGYRAHRAPGIPCALWSRG